MVGHSFECVLLFTKLPPDGSVTIKSEYFIDDCDLVECEYVFLSETIYNPAIFRVAEES